MPFVNAARQIQRNFKQEEKIIYFNFICQTSAWLNIIEIFKHRGKRKGLCDHRLFAVGFIDKTELRPVSSRNKVNIIIATLFEIWNTRNNYTIL